jgi:hypothetical protein
MGVLQKGLSYNLNYYVDLNGNGKCEISPTDEVFRLLVPTVQDHVVLSVQYNTSFSNLGCGGF